jgi:hypothetical protein
MHPREKSQLITKNIWSIINHNQAYGEKIKITKKIFMTMERVTLMNEILIGRINPMLIIFNDLYHVITHKLVVGIIYLLL